MSVLCISGAKLACKLCVLQRELSHPLAKASISFSADELLPSGSSMAFWMPLWESGTVWYSNLIEIEETCCSYPTPYPYSFSSGLKVEEQIWSAHWDSLGRLWQLLLVGDDFPSCCLPLLSSNGGLSTLEPFSEKGWPWESCTDVWEPLLGMLVEFSQEKRQIRSLQPLNQNYLSQILIEKLF